MDVRRGEDVERSDAESSGNGVERAHGWDGPSKSSAQQRQQSTEQDRVVSC